MVFHSFLPRLQPNPFRSNRNAAVLHSPFTWSTMTPRELAQFFMMHYVYHDLVRKCDWCAVWNGSIHFTYCIRYNYTLQLSC